MPKFEEARAPQPGAHGGLPGLWMGIFIAGLAALGVGMWAQPGRGAPAAGGIGRLAEVVPKDIPAALETIDGSAKQVAQFRQREACKRRLAWVSILRAPGQPPGHIRLQSGHYISPAFELTDMPVRVALPYPAPYEAGRGTISVIGTTTDAIVALSPPWHVPTQGGVRAQDVTWTPVAACPADKN